jgi:hypothetical protein
VAILLRGKTRCRICSNVIEERDDVVLFPPFVLNEKNPLHELSDTACHSACVKEHPLGRIMLAAADEFLTHTGPGKRSCVVCGNEIRDPSDYLFIGYLADPSTDKLGMFNYSHLHKSHIRDWKQAQVFLSLAREAITAGEWSGEALLEIIREIAAREKIT